MSWLVTLPGPADLTAGAPAALRPSPEWSCSGDAGLCAGVVGRGRNVRQSVSGRVAVPGQHAACTSVRAACAANKPGHHDPDAEGGVGNEHYGGPVLVDAADGDFLPDDRDADAPMLTHTPSATRSARQTSAACTAASAARPLRAPAPEDNRTGP